MVQVHLEVKFQDESANVKVTRDHKEQTHSKKTFRPLTTHQNTL